jgi:uncharacterized protein YycO
MLLTDLNLRFKKNHTSLTARVIQLWTWSPYSHVELQIGQRTYAAYSKTGVTARRLVEYDSRYWDTVVLRNIDAIRLTTFCENEIGAPYDWYGLVMVNLFGASREHPSAWYCSEFVAAALQDQGVPGFDKRPPVTYRPGDVYKAATGG